MTPLAPGGVIGVLGGGQLGRMLALAAAKLGYPVAIFDPDPLAPAAAVAARHVCAGFDDLSALDDFAASASVVTFEWENVPIAALRRLGRRRPVHPPVAALQASQDRVAEKEFLRSAGTATADFRPVDDLTGLAAALAAFGGGGILKTRRGGYDGKGQVRLGPGDDVARVFAALGGGDLILEAVVPFASEISVIGVRGADGALCVYDPAENRHENGILRRSVVPAAVPAATAAAARDAACRILERLDYVGAIGIEFFVRPDGALLANEMAPRVHNSGHWTEALCGVSQFENHIRAVAGLPLGGGERFADGVMENLLGDEASAAPELLRDPRARLHLYGKAEARPGRKMGHVTWVGAPSASGGRSVSKG